jgi:AcrR family transcriptional regulator
MPPKPRTKAQRAERRQLILDQTRGLAREADWDAVTMRAVAARTRLSAPSLYELFPGKAALLAAVAQEGFAELASYLARRDGDADQDPLERSAVRYWRFAHDDPTLYDLMFHQRLALQFATGKTPAALHAAFEALREAVDDAARTVGVELADPQTTTESWWATIHGVVSLALSRRIRRRPGHAVHLLHLAAETFTAGLRAGQLESPTPARGRPR